MQIRQLKRAKSPPQPNRNLAIMNASGTEFRSLMFQSPTYQVCSDCPTKIREQMPGRSRNEIVARGFSRGSDELRVRVPHRRSYLLLRARADLPARSRRWCRLSNLFETPFARKAFHTKQSRTKRCPCAGRRVSLEAVQATYSRPCPLRRRRRYSPFVSEGRSLNPGRLSR